MIDYGQHESLGYLELGRLPYWSRRRAKRQLAEFLAKAKVPADVQLRWVRTPPFNLRSLAEQLGTEADRLFGIDDPIAPVFEAWSESARLADQVWKMEPGNVE
jgi:hypothetical protein